MRLHLYCPDSVPTALEGPADSEILFRKPFVASYHQLRISTIKKRTLPQVETQPGTHSHPHFFVIDNTHLLSHHRTPLRLTPSPICWAGGIEHHAKEKKGRSSHIAAGPTKLVAGIVVPTVRFVSPSQSTRWGCVGLAVGTDLPCCERSHFPGTSCLEWYSIPGDPCTKVVCHSCRGSIQRGGSVCQDCYTSRPALIEPESPCCSAISSPSYLISARPNVTCRHISYVLSLLLLNTSCLFPIIPILNLRCRVCLHNLLGLLLKQVDIIAAVRPISARLPIPDNHIATRLLRPKPLSFTVRPRRARHSCNASPNSITQLLQMVSLLPFERSRPRAYTTHLTIKTSQPTSMAASNPHNYNFALQKYLMLQEQHQELSTHLDQIRPRLSPSTSVASVSSASTSPIRPSFSNSSSTSSAGSPPRRVRSSGRKYRRCCPDKAPPTGQDVLDTIPDEETLYEISAEERRLFDVNESIKRALTEMLNCQAVRADGSIRMWVQTRLMETEKELRSGRRRRGSNGME